MSRWKWLRRTYVVDRPDDLRQIFREEITQLYNDLDARLSHQRDDLARTFADMRRDLDKTLTDLRRDLDKSLSSMRIDLDELSAQVAELRAQVDGQLKERTVPSGN